MLNVWLCIFYAPFVTNRCGENRKAIFSEGVKKTHKCFLTPPPPGKYCCCLTEKILMNSDSGFGNRFICRKYRNRVTAAGSNFHLAHTETVAAILADEDRPLLFVKTPSRTIANLAGIKSCAYRTVRSPYRQHFDPPSPNIYRIKDRVLRNFRNRDNQIAVRNSGLYHISRSPLGGPALGGREYA
jgi:hypothetical protein